MTCLEITKDIKNTKNFNIYVNWVYCWWNYVTYSRPFSIKARLHLDIDKTSELESVFIEPMTQK